MAATGTLMDHTIVYGNTAVSEGDGGRTSAVITYPYDHLSRQRRGTDAENGETDYAYDVAGRRTGLTDPEENTTQWTYGAHGQMITETITVSSNPLSRAFEYDAAGQLSRRIDRNGRVIDYSRDDLLRQTGETWYRSLHLIKHATNVTRHFRLERPSRAMLYFRRFIFSGWKAARRKPSSRWSDSRRRKSSATGI